MGRISPNRAGLSVAAVLAGWHVAWSLLLAFGVAQWVLEFASTLHGMKAEFVVSPFNPTRAGVLVLVTALIGYVSGAAAAFTWNCLHYWFPGDAVSSQPVVGSKRSIPRRAA